MKKECLASDIVFSNNPSMYRNPFDCMAGGARRKSTRRSPPKRSLYRNSSRCKKKSTKKTQKLDRIINKICKSNKKCTPKYRELLRKIVCKFV